MTSILILCTGNSARSILGEALFKDLGQGKIIAHSAGSTPKNTPHPMALAVLKDHGLATDSFSSKSWNDFAGDGAPPIDIVITVCDSAASEACPVWPGAPVQVHWGLSDPAAVSDDAPDGGQRHAFEATYAALKARIEAALSLPLETMQNGELRAALVDIHEKAIDC